MTTTATAVLQTFRVTTRADGDFHLDHVDPAVLAARRRSIVDLPWTQLDEVHGTEVVVVTRPGEHDRVVGDALVTSERDAVLGVWVGDCAPVAFFGRGGVIGAAHAGWRGLLGGVLARTVSALRELGAGELRAVLGPCIGPCCYAFSEPDLARFRDRWGPSVVGVTRSGLPALDVPATVTMALQELGIGVESVGGCTGCEPDRYWSHRVRREAGRQLLAVWQTGPGPVPS